TNLEASLKEKVSEISELTSTVQSKASQITNLEAQIHQIQRGIVIQLVSRYQRVVEKLLRPGARRRYYYELGLTGIRVILNEGWRSFWSKFRRRLKLQTNLPIGIGKELDHYQKWIAQNEPEAEGLERQKEESLSFHYRPKISIITPVWNPEPKWLKSAIQSVLNQTYNNWELCLADGNSRKPHVKQILKEYAKRDSRIKVKLLPENRGISGNSNKALSLATGEFVGVLDHDDELAPCALFECVKLLNEKPEVDFMYSDNDKITAKGTRFEPYFKPDWSLDMFLSSMYTLHLGIYRKNIIDNIGGFRAPYDSAQDWDLVLRFIEKSDKIYHIPEVLYHWRSHPGSIAAALESKQRAVDAGREVISDYLVRNNISGEVVDGAWLGSYRVRRKIIGNPLVSIVIPTRDRVDILKQCINSVLQKTEYDNYEILIVDNQSVEPATFDYYDRIRACPKIKIMQYDKPFNFAMINNYAVSSACSEHILFLNNDTEVIRADWLSAMLEHSQRREVGAVGAKLLFPDGTIQHCGVVLGLGQFQGHRLPGHAYSRCPDGFGYMGRVSIISNYSAVTGACMMLRKEVFEEVGGFDENLALSYQDIDLCLKLRDKGYLIVYTPYAQLYHRESFTRGYEDTSEKQVHFLKDIEYMRRRWGHLIASGDPYYSPNLNLDRVDFSITQFSRKDKESRPTDESPIRCETRAVAGYATKRKITLATYRDLIEWTLDWTKNLPRSFDVIVGIPRSGLLVASLIALKLGRPLSTPELVVQKGSWESDMIPKERRTPEYCRVLLVDDSIASGEELSKAVKTLRSTKDLSVTTASLITTESTAGLVDLSYKVVPPPYNFEWCLTHQKGNGIVKIAADLDGLICEDCPMHVDVDERLYTNWIKTVKPIFVPTYRIDLIVSNRLEKYRTLTEEWLARNNVRYNKLYLWNVASKEERGGIEKWVEHKVKVLLTEKPDLMYESDRQQAEMIWRASGVPVLWFQEMTIFQ
ncbi:glycosyltransferase, partial [Chloroflexota bacterium]